MNKKSIVGSVKSIVEKILKEQEQKYELVDVEFSVEGSSYFLKIFLDKQGGITIDDCQNISKSINDELDKIDPIGVPYYLEVSSPGLDRPLKNDNDLKRSLGKDIEIKLYEIFEGSKLIQGTLINFDENQIVISLKDENKVNISRKNIALIRLEVKF